MRWRNTNSNSDCKCNANRHPDTDANTNRHSKTDSDAQVTPNSKGPSNATKALKSRQVCEVSEQLARSVRNNEPVIVLATSSHETID